MSWTRGSVWRNNKSGELYAIVGLAKNANNSGPEAADMVVYKRNGEKQLYYRAPEEFLEKFTKELPDED